MIFTQNWVNGSIVVSDIIEGYWVSRVFYGYTPEEAKAEFLAEFPAAIETEGE